MKSFHLSLILALSTFILLSFEIPKGWLEAGTSKKSYKMGIDIGSGQSGNNAATIKSTSNKINGFGTLMQNSLPDNFLGKRVKMSGYVKSENVVNWAGLWLRIDQKNKDFAISFDNMKNRAIKGTTEWKKYEIVLDIPLDATNMAYGALLSGVGQIWFDNISFEVVNDTIEVTSESPQKYMPLSEPSNLNFEN